MVYIPDEIQQRLNALNSELEEQRVQVQGLRTETEDLKERLGEKKAMLWASLVLLLLLGGFLTYTYVSGPIFGKFSHTDDLLQTIDELHYKNQQLRATNDSINAIRYNDAMYLGIGNPIPGVVYRVQIGAYENFSLKGYSDGIMLLSEKRSNNFMKYSLGIFNNYDEAREFKKGLIAMGFKGAFVIAENNGEPISLKNARELEM